MEEKRKISFLGIAAGQAFCNRTPWGFTRKKFSRKIFRIVRYEEPLLSPLLSSPLIYSDYLSPATVLTTILYPRLARISSILPLSLSLSLLSASPSTLSSPFLRRSATIPYYSARGVTKSSRGRATKTEIDAGNDGERAQKQRSLPFVRGAACARARATKAFERPSVFRVFRGWLPKIHRRLSIDGSRDGKRNRLLSWKIRWISSQCCANCFIFFTSQRNLCSFLLS